MIHYEKPHGEVWHYCGTTTEARLTWRLHAHRQGHDTPRTANARALGFKAKHYFISPHADPLMEYALKFDHVCLEACPLCNPPGERIWIRHRAAGQHFQPLHIPTKRERRAAYRLSLNAG